MPSHHRHLFDSSLSLPLQHSAVVEGRLYPFPFPVELCSVCRLRVRIPLKGMDLDALVYRWRNPYSFIKTSDISTHSGALHPQCITYKKEHVDQQLKRILEEDQHIK